MKIGHIELFVSDIVRARHFYELVLGCELVAVQVEQFIWLKLGEIELLLRPGRPEPHPTAYEAASSSIVLYTDRLDDTAASLAKRGIAFSNTSNGCLAFCDPDGHWFQLVDPENQV